MVAAPRVGQGSVRAIPGPGALAVWPSDHQHSQPPPGLDRGSMKREPRPPGTGSSSQNPFPLAGGSPRTLLREASLLHSLGWVPGLGARRVVRPAVRSTPLPQAGLPRGCPGSCAAWSLPAHCPPEAALRTLGALSPGSHRACSSKTTARRTAHHWEQTQLPRACPFLFLSP